MALGWPPAVLWTHRKDFPACLQAPPWSGLSPGQRRGQLGLSLPQRRRSSHQAEAGGQGMQPLDTVSAEIIRIRDCEGARQTWPL